MKRTRTRMALAALLTQLVGCVGAPYEAPPAAAAARTATGVTKPEFVAVAAVDTAVDAMVRDAKAKADAESRRLVVYVGATWCEPCQRFHDAVERGELDVALAGVRFLEFDADRHGAALDAAGYGGELIPRFAVPGADGRGSDAKIEGSVKGEAAVAQIMRRLEKLLAT